MLGRRVSVKSPSDSEEATRLLNILLGLDLQPSLGFTVSSRRRGVVTIRSTSIRLLAFALGLASATACGSGHPSNVSWEQAFDPTATGWLLSVWGPTDDDVYAVGGTATAGVVWHFDGSKWTQVAHSAALLNWVYGFSRRDVTVVGNSGAVLHYDGTSWTPQTAPTDQDLWGVWGAVPNDLWAVGGRGRNPGDATLLHYDGSAWTAETLPTFQRAGVYALYKVWGTSADNVYAVGQNGAVIHRVSGQWTEELAGASGDLISLWGTGPDHIVAVGGRENAIVAIWTAGRWHSELLGSMPGLNGVWLRNDSVAHVAGESGEVARLDPSTLRVYEERQDTPLDLHGIFGTPGGRLYTVGGNFLGPVPPYQGIALTRRLGADE